MDAMDQTTQAHMLRTMLSDSHRLCQSGDPLLKGLYDALQARIAFLISVLDDCGEPATDTER
jgi:hypothetical protein